MLRVVSRDFRRRSGHSWAVFWGCRASLVLIGLGPPSGEGHSRLRKKGWIWVVEYDGKSGSRGCGNIPGTLEFGDVAKRQDPNSVVGLRQTIFLLP